MTRRADPRPEEIETLAPIFKNFIRDLQDENDKLRRANERLEKQHEKESQPASRAQHPAESGSAPDPSPGAERLGAG